MPVLTHDTREAPAATAPLRIGSVALVVRDLPRVERFYRDAIGLQVAARTQDRVGLGAGGQPFLWLTHVPDARPDDPATAGLFHTAFLLPSRADLGRWLTHAGRIGLSLDGAADHLVSEAVYLHDPEGNGIEVYVDRPRSQWRWIGGQVAMANDRLDIAGLRRDGGTVEWPGAPAGTVVGHIHLRVGEVAGAVQFYRDAIGLEVTRAMPAAAFLSTGGYHHHLAVNTWGSAGAGLRDPGMAGLESVTFEAPDQAVLDGIAGRADLSPAGNGLHDPWGTRLQFRLASASNT